MSIIYRIQSALPLSLAEVNFYFIQDSLPTLIDAGINTEECFNLLDSSIRQCGSSLSRIKRIILTHGHLDHMGLAGKVKEISGAEVYIHQLDKNKSVRGANLRSSISKYDFNKFFREAGSPENLIRDTSNYIIQRFAKYIYPLSGVSTVGDGERFDFDDFRITVISTPGHTAGSICLLNEEDGTLFSGDSLLKKIIPKLIAEVKDTDKLKDYKSLCSYEGSLKRLESLKVKSIYPGHGSPFYGHLKRIKQLKNYYGKQKRKVLQIIGDFENSADKKLRVSQYMIGQKLFSFTPGINKKSGVDMFPFLSETRAYIEALEEEGLVTSRKYENMLLYSLI